MSIINRTAESFQSELKRIRRWLHTHPELSFEEVDTTDFLADEFSKVGYIVNRVTQTGFLAELPGLPSLPLVAIRAEIDALPIAEQNKVAYRSLNTGIMHACGHDAHAAMAYGAALILQKYPFPVRFIIQPAEETSRAGKSGANLMIEQGALEGIRAIIGQHLNPDIPLGKVAIVDGAAMSAAIPFKISIAGQGGHVSVARQISDPTKAATAVLNGIFALEKEFSDANDQPIIRVGKLANNSQATNIIANEVNIWGTMRTFSKEKVPQLIEALSECCKLVEKYGATYTINFVGSYPVLMNDSYVAAQMRRAAIEVLGSTAIYPPFQWSAAEDFAKYTEHCSACFAFLGIKTNELQAGLHTPDFDLDESVLWRGAALLARTAMNLC